jgi:thiol:disulfide interchange protein DsbC
MRKFILIISASIIAITLSIVPYVFGIEEGQSAKLTKEDAINLLKEMIPEIKILEIRPAQVEGLWEIAVEAKGKKGIVYLDSSKKYLVSGSIIDLKTKANLTQERSIELNRIDVSQIPLDDALVMGDKDAKYRVIIFTDPDCPYCGKLHQEMKKIIDKRKDIAFFTKLYPLPMHKGAYEKAKAIVCEKSLALLDDAFEKKPLPEPKCETTALDENLKLAEKLGIRGTPAIILPNGTIIPGYKDADSLIPLIEKTP